VVSGSEASEASGAASDEQQTHSDQQHQPVEQLEHEVKQKKKKKDTEDISQADTDHDAPSIHSDLGSPIPFEVEKTCTPTLLLPFNFTTNISHLSNISRINLLIHSHNWLSGECY